MGFGARRAHAQLRHVHPVHRALAEELGRTMRTEMTLPPARLTYHHGTIMRPNDFMFGAMIDAALSPPKCTSAPTATAPRICASTGALGQAAGGGVVGGGGAGGADVDRRDCNPKLHAADGVAPSMGGMPIALSQPLRRRPTPTRSPNLSRASSKEADLSGADGAAAAAGGRCVHLAAADAEDQVGVVCGGGGGAAARGAPAAPHPLPNGLPGGGGGRRGAGVPELTVAVSFPPGELEMNMTAAQAALLYAVQTYNFGSKAVPVTPPVALAPEVAQMVVTLPFDSLTIHLRAEDVDHDYDEHVGAVVLREFRSTMTFRASEALEVDMTLRAATVRGALSGERPGAFGAPRLAYSPAPLPTPLEAAASDPAKLLFMSSGLGELDSLAEESAPARITTTKEAFGPMVSLSAPMRRRELDPSISAQPTGDDAAPATTAAHRTVAPPLVARRRTPRRLGRRHLQPRARRGAGAVGGGGGGAGGGEGGVGPAGGRRRRRRRRRRPRVGVGDRRGAR